MLKNILLLLIFSVSSLFLSCSEKQIHIVHVTDVHGHLYPYDYVRNTPTTNSLAGIYTFVDSLRSSGEDVLLIDTGDLLQGTPMIYYFCDIDTTRLNPAAAAFNYMGLSAMVVGNHDIEKGPGTYRKFERELKAPLLSANADLTDGSTSFSPYYVFDVNGMKIGLIGLTTPAIPLWLPESSYPGINWTDITETASKYVPKLSGSVDYLIAGVHAGIDSVHSLEATERRGLPPENYVLNLAISYPELDLILCGHEHRIIPGKYHQNTGEFPPISMPAAHARIFNHIILEKDREPVISVKQTSWYEPDPGLIQLLMPYHEKTLEYANASISETEKELTMRTAYFYDNALIDFIQEVQLDVAGAEVSFAACFNPKGKIEKGSVTVRDIFALYIFENYLVGINMTGAQIKNYLEESARFYTGKDSANLLRSGMPGYNFDIASGLEYTIDISKDPGNRVEILRISGRKFQANKIYKVVMNSYRASGGGGHLSATGIKDPDIFYKSSVEIRNLLISALQSGKCINHTPDKNWKVIGDPEFYGKVEKWVNSRSRK